MAAKTDVSHNFARQLINIVAFIAFVVIPGLAVTLPFNGNYLMDVVAKYSPDFMVPAYAWYISHAVVYVFLLCFIVYQALPHKRNDRVIRSIDILFCVLVLANIVWTFGFFYEVQTLALVGSIVGATCAFLIYDRLGVGRDRASRTTYWCVHFPFSVAAATALFGIVSELSIFCIHYELVWWGVGETSWNIIAMLIVTFFGSVFMHYRPDAAFGVTCAWLSAGLAVHQGNQNPVISAFAYLMTLYFALATFLNGMHRPRLTKKDTK